MSTNSRPTYALAAIVAGVVFLANLKTLSSFDVWYHLSLGRTISETGELPRQNLLSYTAAEHPALPLSWLFQWWLYQLHRAGGIPAIVVFRAVVLSGTFVLLLMCALRRGAGPITACALLGLAAIAARSRFVDRPQVVAYLLIASQVWLLERFLRRTEQVDTGGRDLTREGIGLLVVLGVLQAVWANVHGSAILGVIVPAVYALGLMLDRVVLKRGTTGRRFSFILASPVVTAVSIAANPMGWGILTYPLTHARGFQELGIKDFFVERAGVRLPELLGTQWPFAVLVMFCVAGLIASRRRVSSIDLGLLCSIGAAFHSARFVGEAVLLVTPVAAGLLSPWVDRLAARHLSGEWKRLWVAGSLFLLLSLGAALRDHRPWGFEVDRNEYPVAATDYVEKTGLGTRIFNDFEFGGYLAWRGIDVFMDSRGPGFYPAGLFRSYLSVIDRRFPSEARGALDELEREFGFRTAIVHHHVPKKLFRSAELWEETYTDDTATVFVKRAE